LPRQPRCKYAADFPRSLSTGIANRLQSQPTSTAGCALHPGPYPPDLSRCHDYGALSLVSLVYRLISLAGPGLSGSAKPSRLCQRCLPSSPASPESDCAQLLPSCCDSSTRRSCTSSGSQRLTAHRDLVAQRQQLGNDCRLAARQDRQPPEQAHHDQVEESKTHDRRSCLIVIFL
jgi:hypothetical protein